MLFTLLFALWTATLAACWVAPRSIAMGAVVTALVLSLALFAHHVTDPLKLSF